MKLLIFGSFAVWACSLVFVSCNNETEEGQTTTDTTATAQTETTTTNTTMDAVAAAPDRYQVLKDSMGIRILKINYKPGDSSAIHSHPDNVLYVITGGKSEFMDTNGNKQEFNTPAGFTAIGPSETHSVKNIGTTTTDAILVEVNRPNKAADWQSEEKDAVQAAPQLYKVLKDSMNIRTVMATYKPGAASPMHFHPDHTAYVLESSRVEFTNKDGSKEVRQLDKGMALLIPSHTHSVKNIGTTTLKVLLVEVNRPVQ
jgi:quercetin dioxygenase-like cupin family protein